eukprot:TRINITY_DN1657_c0_g1_i1.p1 TRINITY_DN1657_c0_g1~~TRINITY_DN1657_c0_g1_i1.p1  ORF type:complete len:652 (-),score=224.02 TRINITY_DN1657_c0_g1_i1:40-1842(-)
MGEGGEPLSVEEKNLKQIQDMFGEDLTKSVISTVFLKNKGDVAQAVDMLLDIHHDEEAIDAIRAMNSNEKEELQKKMISEQEKRLLERQEVLMKEIADEEKALRNEVERKERERKDADKAFALRQEELAKQTKQEEARLAAIKAQVAELTQKKVTINSEQLQKQEEKEKLLQQLADEAADQLKIRQERKAELKQLDVEEQKQMEKKREFLKQKELLVSRIVVGKALCTLGVRYSEKTVIVSWSLGKDLQGLPADWIGFFKLGNKDYRQYIKTGGKRTGTHHFTAPKTPGLYVFRYFVDGSYNEVATSDVIHIGPQLKLVSTLNEEEKTVSVTVTKRSGEVTTSDWFGFYKASEKNNKKYVASQYIGESDVNAKTFTLNFPAPRTPGDYVVRFFPKRCKYTNVTSSNSIRIENRDRISTSPFSLEEGRVVDLLVKFDIHSVDVTKWDYVAVYPLGKHNNDYVSHKYVDPPKKTLVVPAPIQVGKYEVRFHSGSQSKYVDCVRSVEFEIENRDVVEAKKSGSLIPVTWKIHSQPKSKWDWVGLFLVGTANTQYVQYKYINVSTNALVFDAPTAPGNYEVRYFSYHHGKYEDFRKSELILISA